MTSPLKTAVLESIKDAMRARQKERLGVLRMISAEFKRIEVDERTELDDERVLAVMDKMLKQRKDSAEQYDKAERPELAEQERFEMTVIKEFLPEPLSEDELRALVASTAADTNANSMADMGKLMAALKPKVQGRADMGRVSQMVKAQLS